MTLHLSQIFLTDALTFINQFSVLSCQFSVTATADSSRSFASLRACPESAEGTTPAASRFAHARKTASLVAIHNPPAIQIVRRKFDCDFVSRQYPYKVLPHLAGNVRQYLVLIFELHLEHGIGQRLDHRCHHFNRVFFTHRLLKKAFAWLLAKSQQLKAATGSKSPALAALPPRNAQSARCNCRRALRPSTCRSKPWSRDDPNSPSAQSPGPYPRSTPRPGPSCQSSESAALHAASSRCRAPQILAPR